MKKRVQKTAIITTISVVLYILACRAFPGFARAALKGFSLPVMGWLHRRTAKLPFPFAEVLGLGALSILLSLLAAALFRAVAARDGRPLRRWLAGFAGTALLLADLLILLWAPARGLPGEAYPAPDGDRLARLCGALVDRLNASDLSFPEPGAILALAPRAAGAEGCAVKAVRYPEWMRAAHISGLFLPLTGEALVDAAAPRPLVPFTAVHELAHLAGVADEGAANIAAWQRCMEAGGVFADSARLWALRYGMGLLRGADPRSWRHISAKMEGALARAFRMCGGEIVPRSRETSALPWFSFECGDYAALIRYLARSPDF